MRVLDDFLPETQDEIGLSSGDVVEVLEENEDGWWKGRVNGQEGMFLSNFVETIDDEPQETTIQESLNSGEERFLWPNIFWSLIVLSALRWIKFCWDG